MPNADAASCPTPGTTTTCQFDDTIEPTYETPTIILLGNGPGNPVAFYDPLFSGTLWGANAFNGVLNIVTRNARDTQGVLAAAAAGNEESYSDSFGPEWLPNIRLAGVRSHILQRAAHRRSGRLLA